MGLGRIDADTTSEVGREQTIRIKPTFDFKEFPVARINAIELLGPQDLVFGKVDFTTTPDRSIDEAINSLPAVVLVAHFWMKFKIEAIAIL